MDLIERIDELQALVEEAKSVPLSSSAVVDRPEFLELLAQMKQVVPEEIRQARWMTRDKEELMERARNEADRILQEAREQRDRLLSRTEIVHAAQREAEKIVNDSKDKATKLQLQAEDYIDQKLAAFEILLNKTLSTVGRGREQLRGEQKVEVGVDNGPPPPAPSGPQSGPFDVSELQKPSV